MRGVMEFIMLYRSIAMMMVSLALLSCDEGSAELPNTQADTTTAEQGDGGGTALRIQGMGDSALDWNESKSSVSMLGTLLKAKGVSAYVENNAVSGATMGCGEDGIGDAANCVPPQYKQGQWDYVILSGGANDIGDSDCQHSADLFVSPDLKSGLTVAVVDDLVKKGAKVLLYSYFLARDADHPLMKCDQVVLLLKRYKALAENRPAVTLVDASEVIKPAQTQLYAEDGIHPSPAGSKVIAEHIVSLLGH